MGVILLLYAVEQILRCLRDIGINSFFLFKKTVQSIETSADYGQKVLSQEIFVAFC